MCFNSCIRDDRAQFQETSTVRDVFCLLLVFGNIDVNLAKSKGAFLEKQFGLCLVCSLLTRYFLTAAVRGEG